MKCRTTSQRRSEYFPDARADIRRAIAAAELRFIKKRFCFKEFPLDVYPLNAALAIVRDEHLWSLLVLTQDNTVERSNLFSFHFAPGLDNSGVVGWPASHLEIVPDTGVFIVGGQNADRGGIFDYQGVSEAVIEQAQARLNVSAQPAETCKQNFFRTGSPRPAAFAFFLPF